MSGAGLVLISNRSPVRSAVGRVSRARFGYGRLGRLSQRFDEMVRRTGAPRDTLAARLRTLVDADILERRRYSEHPARFEYRLTEAGREPYPVILTLMRWGDRHLAGPDGPPLILEQDCGHRRVAQVVCEACGEPVSAGDAKAVTVGR